MGHFQKYFMEKFIRKQRCVGHILAQFLGKALCGEYLSPLVIVLAQFSWTRFGNILDNNSHHNVT